MTKLTKYPGVTIAGRDDPALDLIVGEKLVTVRIDYGLRPALWTEVGFTHEAWRRALDTSRHVLLKWEPEGAEDDWKWIAWLGTETDGVSFRMGVFPSCYRRGPYRLQIDVCGGPNHHKWGCFDEADQPLRYFHSDGNARDEAERIAHVLLEDRKKIGGFVLKPK